MGKTTFLQVRLITNLLGEVNTSSLKVELKIQFCEVEIPSLHLSMTLHPRLPQTQSLFYPIPLHLPIPLLPDSLPLLQSPNSTLSHFETLLLPLPHPTPLLLRLFHLNRLILPLIAIGTDNPILRIQF